MIHFLIGFGVALYVGSKGIKVLRVASVQASKKKQDHLVERYKNAFESPMNRKEAGLILGVSPYASKEEVLMAYKALMMINHPDRGGTEFIAKKINEAKDILLKSE